MRRKKVVSLLTAAAMLAGMTAIPAQAADVKITIFNSKMEIQSQRLSLCTAASSES